MQRIRGVQVRAPQRIAARSTACVSPVEEQASLWRLARPDDEDESSSHASCSSDQHRSMNVSWNRLERMWNYDEKSIDIETLMATSPIASASQASAVEEKPPPTVPPQPGGPNKGGDGGKSPDYYANVGDAIRTLRDDIPRLFERDINYDIYREDLAFVDPNLSFQGIKNYKLLFWSLRFHGSVFFSKLRVEIKRIWQPEDGLIKMRWTVHGVPRVPWEAEGIFDGISIYKIDSQGKIYEHSVTNFNLRDPPLAIANPLSALNLKPAQTPQLGSWITGNEEEVATSLATSSSTATLDLSLPTPSSPFHSVKSLAPSRPEASHVRLATMKSWFRLYHSLISSLFIAQGLSQFIRKGRRYGSH